MQLDVRDLSRRDIVTCAGRYRPPGTIQHISRKEEKSKNQASTAGGPVSYAHVVIARSLDIPRSLPSSSPTSLPIMSRVAELPSRNPFSAAGEIPSRQRNLPVLSGVTSPDGLSADPMDVSPPTSFPAAAPPVQVQVQNCSEGDQGGPGSTNGSTEASGINAAAPNPNIGAAAAAQQPKVVQTAFIHKLYKYVVARTPDSSRSRR